MKGIEEMTCLITFVILVGIIIILILCSRSSKSEYTYEYKPAEEEEYHVKRTPKISAEITETLDNRVRNYCSNHSLSISDLIRKAVTDYMDRNP